jgi:predicted transcriptional regulator of viral defense system
MPVLRDRTDLRRRLTRIAAAQSGYFTTADALGAGYSYSAQRYHVNRGNWEQVDRALFRLPEWPVDLEEQYVRWFLWSRKRAVVSHETALSIYDMSDVNPERVHLTVPPAFRMRAPGVVLHTADLPDEDVRERAGYRITTPLRAVLDVAAAYLSTDEVAKAIADGERQGRFTRRMLIERVSNADAQAAVGVERALRSLRSVDA